MSDPKASDRSRTAEAAETAEAGDTEQAGHTGETRSARGEIEIDARPERVWRALTEAAELERWFPLEARVEPGEGGSIFLSWKNEFAGESEILVWDPPRHLRTEWGFSEEETGQITDYELEGRGGKTFLRVVTSGFPLDPSWDDWVEGTQRGWAFELASLKRYLERNSGEDRAVIYLRRRVPLSREEAWGRLLRPEGLGERLPGGEPFDESPPVQYAAVVDDPPGALMRASVEPSPGGPGAREVVLWLQAWGEGRSRLPEIEKEWRRALEALFPEGEVA